MEKFAGRPVFSFDDHEEMKAVINRPWNISLECVLPIRSDGPWKVFPFEDGGEVICHTGGGKPSGLLNGVMRVDIIEDGRRVQRAVTPMFLPPEGTAYSFHRLIVTRIPRRRICALVWAKLEVGGILPYLKVKKDGTIGWARDVPSLGRQFTNTIQRSMSAIAINGPDGIMELLSDATTHDGFNVGGDGAHEVAKVIGDGWAYVPPEKVALFLEKTPEKWGDYFWLDFGGYYTALQLGFVSTHLPRCMSYVFMALHGGIPLERAFIL